MATLASYLIETRLYLHDASGTYWSDANLTLYINKAMQQRDRDSGMNRSTLSFTLTPNQAAYSAQAVASSGTLLVGSSRNLVDVLGIVCVWGNVRAQMAEAAYTTLGSELQPYQGYTNLPVAFAKYGADTIIFGPTPNAAYVSEWDLIVYADALVNPTDPDPLPYPWTDPVPFKAAEFAKQELQQYEEAKQYRDQYLNRLSEVAGGARGRMLTDPYARMRPWP